MKKELLKIIEYFGINNQQRKLNEEVFELQEAIMLYQSSGWDFSDEDCIEIEKKYKNHIIEEMADVILLLGQFKINYDITSDEIIKILRNKVDRTLERIESGYYEK